MSEKEWTDALTMNEEFDRREAIQEQVDTESRLKREEEEKRQSDKIVQALTAIGGKVTFNNGYAFEARRQSYTISFVNQTGRICWTTYKTPVTEEEKKLFSRVKYALYQEYEDRLMQSAMQYFQYRRGISGVAGEDYAQFIADILVAIAAPTKALSAQEGD